MSPSGLLPPLMADGAIIAYYMWANLITVNGPTLKAFRSSIKGPRGCSYDKFKAFIIGLEVGL